MFGSALRLGVRVSVGVIGSGLGSSLGRKLEKCACAISKLRRSTNGV